MRICWTRFMLKDRAFIPEFIQLYAVMPKEERIKKIRWLCKNTEKDQQFVREFMPDFFYEALPKKYKRKYIEWAASRGAEQRGE